MAIPTLTPEQVRTWSRREKDSWWLANVFRGDMAQLTVRSALTGFMLGGLLSATNLYVGAKTGWTLGVGLTSVILAFAMFRAFSRLGFSDMTILENNAMQSVATAAGYMTGPLISGMTAYMWIENRLIPWWQTMGFLVILSLLGVLVAFPMKRRFINDEQQPFPEGRACGVLLDTLYTSSAAAGVFKAKALAIAAAVSGGITFLSGASYMTLIQEKWLGITEHWELPHDFDGVYAWLASKGREPRLSDVTLKNLGFTPALELAMFGAGALMGIRSASSLLLGMVLNYFVFIPLMISWGEIGPRVTYLGDNSFTKIVAGEPEYGRAHLLNSTLWWGVALMVTAAMVSLFAKPKVFVEAIRTVLTRRRGGRAAERDPVAHIEMPLWISWVGMPLVGGVGVWAAWAWFDVPVVYGALSIPLIILLTLIAASSTALTGTTPTGALSKIPQFGFGAANPTHPATNLMTGVMCVEVASNASNLLMDIKPGYMLGAKPRQQAIGHSIGIVSGAIFATPLFYVLFTSGFTPGAEGSAGSVKAVMTEGTGFGFPSSVQWEGVSRLITSIFAPGSEGSLLTPVIVWSMIIAAVAALVLEVIRLMTRNRFPISPLAIGLGVVVPPDSTLMMFCGALFFWAMHRLYAKRPESTGNLLWIQTHEPICAGIIAGAALVGIGDTLIKVLVLK
ncbi:oligopeptide transporter, OPT family [soil metagenome]